MTKRRLNLANNPLLSGPAMIDRERISGPYKEIKITQIDRDENQPRLHFDEERLAELSASIKLYGVLNPIIVRPSTVTGRYIVIAGERRFRASLLAGKDTIPAIVDYEQCEGDSKTLMVQLVENLQRADLTPLERAQAISALKERYSLSIRDIAAQLGISKSMVQRSLDILGLPEDLIKALQNGASESKVLLLANIDDPEIRAGYLKDIESITREALSKEIKEERGEGTGTKLTPEDLRLVDEMRRALGLRVKLTRVEGDQEKGKITVEFYSQQDLQEVFRRLIGGGSLV